MRVLLFTGKGGVGKTTAAAATAVHGARTGLKTLVLSTDAAHSLGDALALPEHLARASAGVPVELESGLSVLQVDTQARFERAWGDIRAYLLGLLDATGVDSVSAEELTVLPGADEVMALLEVRDQVRSGGWDLVVVDCAPTAETLRLLALPEALRWYADRLFPPERRVARSLRPLLGRIVGTAGVAPPDAPVLDAIGRLEEELADVVAVLADPGTSVRLVLTPEAVVVAEARRTLTALSLYGYRVDGVVANRVFPADVPDPWVAGWAQAQRERLAEIVDSFGPLPVLQVPYQAAEPVGPDALGALAAAVYDGVDAFAEATGEAPLVVERSGAEFVLSLALPFADRDDTVLARSGDELVVTVGSVRRVIALPSALRRCTVVGAAMRDGRLRVRFEPDPSLWMGP